MKTHHKPRLLGTSAKLLGLALSTAVLAACDGGEVTGSSSDNSVTSSSSVVTQSSTPQVSSSAPTQSSEPVASSSSSVATGFTGDPDQGFTKFDVQCSACHTDNGDGTFGSFAFDVNGFQYPSESYANGPFENTVEGLSAYISDQMPSANFGQDPATCAADDNCADDIAAYLWSLRSGTSSSAATSSSAPAIETTQFSDFTTDISNGQAIYDQMCSDCHGAEGKGEGLTQLPIKLGNFPLNSILHTYVESNMPKKGETTDGTADCVGQCAADVTALMDTWRAPEVAACSAENPVIYSERSLKLLTSSEYRNTIQDLFPNAQVPSELLGTIQDIKIGRFPNHFDLAVVNDRAREFMRNAEGIAGWAIENDVMPA
ncbi:MAG TPA: c-type cytochrome, partial [Marinagarivorans sp.]